jgi:hypothetical protein
MYTISKDFGGVVLICHDCAHIERVTVFSETLGSRRTQAARAMQIHSQEQARRRFGSRRHTEKSTVTSSLR